jgi:hypothetical protein
LWKGSKRIIQRLEAFLILSASQYLYNNDATRNRFFLLKDFSHPFFSFLGAEIHRIVKGVREISRCTNLLMAAIVGLFFLLPG